MKKFIVFSIVLSLVAPSRVFSAFSDVDSITSYNEAIEWMAENEIIQGYQDGTFQPEKCFNRAELLKVILVANEEPLYRIDNVTSSDYDNYFTDTSVNEWYWPYIIMALENGIIEGYQDKTFKPSTCVNRVEAIKMALMEFNNGEIPQIDEYTGNSLLNESYQDLNFDTWYGKYVYYALTKNIIGNGHVLETNNSSVTLKSSRYYHPGGEMSRKEVTEMLYRIKAVKDSGVVVYTPDLIPTPPMNYSSIRVFNSTEKPQEVKFFVNDNTHLFGSLENFEELLKYIVMDARSDKEIVQKVFKYFDNGRVNFCSEASPIEEVRLQESFSDRLFSYSFGCCSDVAPMLAYAYELLGYDATLIANPEHVMGEVNTESQYYLFDTNFSLLTTSSFQQSKSMNFSNIDASSQIRKRYEEIFIDNGDKNFFYSPENTEISQLSTAFSVLLKAGENIVFNNELIANRVVTYPTIPKETQEDYYESVFQYLGNGILSHNLKYSSINNPNEDGCYAYEFDSPYVIIRAALSNIDLEKIKSIFFSIDGDTWNNIDHLATDFTLNYKIFSHGKKELILETQNILDDWGRGSYRYYLPLLTINWDMNTKRNFKDFVLYENNTPLPYPDSQEILENGKGGQYILLRDNMILFKTTDNSDPRTNGREYKAEFTQYSSLDEPFGRYHYYLKVCPSIDNDFSFEDTLTVDTVFQYNRLLLPNIIERLENLNPLTTVEVQ